MNGREHKRPPFASKLNHVEIVEHYQKRLHLVGIHLSETATLEHVLRLLRDHDCHYPPHLEAVLNEILPLPSQKAAS